MGAWSIAQLSMAVSAHIIIKTCLANMQSDVVISVVSYRGTERSRKDWVLVFFWLLIKLNSALSASTYLDNQTSSTWQDEETEVHAVW